MRYSFDRQQLTAKKHKNSVLVFFIFDFSLSSSKDEELGIFTIIIDFVLLIVSLIDFKSLGLTSIKVEGIRKLYAFIIAGFGILTLSLQSLFFFADRGFNYLLVSPTGNMSAVMEQGITWSVFRN